jgi:hypothetical protein
MKKKTIALLLAALLTAGFLAGCGNTKENDTTAENTETQQEDTSQVATPEEMTTVEDVVEEGMSPIYGTDLQDGTYEVTVDSSSSMFHIVSCSLTVEDGNMTAVMTMSGTGYRYLYMGTGEEAAAADKSTYIPYVEDASGSHTFTVPVEALDQGIACTAFSNRKEKWYDRTILFRADSLPTEAYKEGKIITAASLNLADGTYTVEVTLSGGSGKASVQSPATLTVANGQCSAVIVWSSSHYDYMLVNEEKYLPVNQEGNSTFEIPVTGFDYAMPVVADTTAMSEPHEISYTLNFDSTSIKADANEN